jgi:hypothetical protein
MKTSNVNVITIATVTVFRNTNTGETWANSECRLDQGDELPEIVAQAAEKLVWELDTDAE